VIHSSNFLLITFYTTSSLSLSLASYLQPSAMATGQSSTPSFFHFLKEGLLLPSHNRRLFAAVFTVIAASTCLLLLGNDLAVQPLRDQLDQDKKALHSADPRTSSLADILQLIQKTKNDARALVLTSAAYSLFGAITKSAIQVVVVFAAVATYSGDKLLTFGSLLGKVKAQLKGPVLTLAFVYALEIAYVALLAAMSALLMFLKIKKYLGLLAVASLLFLVAVVFLLYFSFLCSMSVVVAVAEPGCHGAGALGRAWRLMKGKHRRAMLFVFVTALLAVALTLIYTLAKRCAVTDMGEGLLLGFLYSIFMSAVQLFAACAMAAFYYECKGSTTEASAVEYVKVSTKEQVDA